MRFRIAILGAIGFCAVLVSAADAQYFRKPISDLDPSIMEIDEKKFLGARLDPATRLVDETGTVYPLSDHLGKPLVLLLSYYTCDGSCSVINGLFLDLLEDVERVSPGVDFGVLTLSFDRHDTLETAGTFKRHLGIGADYADAWTFATFESVEDLKAETAKIGFKFFWSPEDKVFLHPGAFLFLSPEGRLIRILYPPNVDASDVELAVLDAKQGQFRPQQIINFALSLCYSFNYAEGRYTLSIPIFVGFGALFIGLTALAVSILVFKSRKRRNSRKLTHAPIA